MKKFIALYHLPPEALTNPAHMQINEQQKAETMAAWGAWNERSGSAIVDMGAPLMGGQSVDSSMTWQPSTKGVSGYSIVQAASMNEARALFTNHIHLGGAPGATVELHEVIHI